MKSPHHLLLFLASLVFTTAVVAQQEAPAGPDILARNDARKIAIKFRERGYTISPALSGGLPLGKATCYEVTAEKATDCVIMVGISSGMAVNLIVKDEVGNIIAQDQREQDRACVAFTAAYSGSYSIYVLPESTAHAAGSFSVLLGTRTQQAISR